jgi:hypothetical protein
MTHVFHGLMYRARLRVFDFSDYAEQRRAAGEEVIVFGVEVLPRFANRFAAFSTGRTVYHGPDLREAMARLRVYVPTAELPAKFRRYLTG